MKISLNKKKIYFININILSFKYKIIICLYIFFYSIFITFRINYKKIKIINPKISIFLPIYNKNIYLVKSIRSIQNQTLKQIEIIGVNDFSTDNSLNILKKLSKIDSRIKIINNDRNHGLLYARAMGILNSTGEFLINLDPDDQFYEENNLENLYIIAKAYNVDVLNFSFKHKNRTKLKCIYNNKIIKKPQLFKSAYNNYNRLKDYLIWNKMIKRKIMLKAYKKFKNRVYSQKWNYHEDNIWSILIYRYANSMLCINNIIYIYNSLEDSLMKNIHGSNIQIKNLIYRIEILRIIYNKKSYIKYIIGEYYKLIFGINKDLILLKNMFDIKGKFIKLLSLCIKFYKCPNYIINNIIKFIKIIEYNQIIYRNNN